MTRRGDDLMRLRCPDCDDFGHLPDRTDCPHQDVYVTAAERGAAAARAAIRPPKLPTITTGDLP